MAVFLLNQCAFSKINTNINGTDQSNICGLRFDTLFELIHHIEDNHISELECPTSGSQFYNGHPQQQQPAHQMVNGSNIISAQPFRDIIPHDRNHMTQIMNGCWLPTSCILPYYKTQHGMRTHPNVRHDNSSQPYFPPVTSKAPSMPSMPLMSTQVPTMVVASPQPQPQPQPVLVAPQQTQPQHTLVVPPPQLQPQPQQPPQPQAQPQPPQPVIVAPQQAQPQHALVVSTPQLQPQQPPQNMAQPQTQTQTQPPPPPHQPQASAAATSKPYKCPDCNKTYKTQHGLRTHQSVRHENSSQPYTPPVTSKAPSMPSMPLMSTQVPTMVVASPQPQPQPQPVLVAPQQTQPQHTLVVPPPQLQPQQPQPQTQPMLVAPQQVQHPIVVSTPQLQPQQPSQPQSNQSQASAAATSKPYKCPDCNKTYKTQHGLRTHQSAHHENANRD